MNELNTVGRLGLAWKAAAISGNISRRLRPRAARLANKETNSPVDIKGSNSLIFSRTVSNQVCDNFTLISNDIASPVDSTSL